METHDDYIKLVPELHNISEELKKHLGKPKKFFCKKIFFFK
jgi:hypothetical protein